MSRPTTPTSEFLSNLESFLKKFKLTTENHKDQEILTLANLDSGRIRKFIVKKVDERSLFGRRNSQKSLKDENENKSRKNSFKKKKDKKEGKRKLSTSSLHSLKKEKKEGKRKLSSSSLHSLKVSCNIRRFGSSKSLSTEAKKSPTTEKKKRRSSFGSGKFKLGWGSSSESDSDDVFDEKEARNAFPYANRDIDPGFTNEALVQDEESANHIGILVTNEDTNIKSRNPMDHSDTDSISSMETDSPSSSPRFNLKMSPIPKRNRNKKSADPSYSPVSFRGGYQSNRSSISSVRKGILKKTNSCTTINMEMNNLSRPQTPTENKSIESFEETYSNGDATRFTRTGDNPHLRHQRSFNRVKFILDSGRPDNITGDYDDIKIEKNEKSDRTDKGKILTNSNEKRLTRSGKKCLIFSAGILIMSMAVVVGSLYGSRNARKTLTGDSIDSKFIASALEGKFKIINENFNPVLYNYDSEEFKKMSKSLEEFIVKAIFVEESVNEANSTIKLRIVRYEKGSVICTFRLKWQEDQTLELAEIRKRIWNHLDKYGAFGEYKVEKNSFVMSELKNLCARNTQPCSHICIISEETLRFDCTCPDNLILFNNTNCVSPKPSTTTAKNPVAIPPIINKILKINNANLVSVNQETVSKDQPPPTVDEKVSGSKDNIENGTKIEEAAKNKTISLMGNSTAEKSEESQQENPKLAEVEEDKVTPVVKEETKVKHEEMHLDNDTSIDKKLPEKTNATKVDENISQDTNSKSNINKTIHDTTAVSNATELKESSSVKTLENKELEAKQKNDTNFNNTVIDKTNFTQIEVPSPTHNTSETELVPTKASEIITESSNNNTSPSSHSDVTTIISDKNYTLIENLESKNNETNGTILVNDILSISTSTESVKIEHETSKNSTNGSEVIHSSEESDKKVYEDSKNNNATTSTIMSNTSEASVIVNNESDIKVDSQKNKNNEQNNTISSTDEFNLNKSSENDSENSKLKDHTITTYPTSLSENEIHNATLTNFLSDTKFNMSLNSVNVSNSDIYTSASSFASSTESPNTINNNTTHEPISTDSNRSNITLVNATKLSETVENNNSEISNYSDLDNSKSKSDVASYSTDYNFSNSSFSLNTTDPIVIFTLPPDILLTEDPNLNEVSSKAVKDEKSEEHDLSLKVNRTSNVQQSIAKDKSNESVNNISDLDVSSFENPNKSIDVNGTSHSESALKVAITSNISESEPSHTLIPKGDNSEAKINDLNPSNNNDSAVHKIVDEKDPKNNLQYELSDSQKSLNNETLNEKSNSSININIISNVSHDLSISPINETQEHDLSDNTEQIKSGLDISMNNVGMTNINTTLLPTNSTTICHEDQLQCSDGSCYLKKERCDSVSNCFDHSDETSCPENECFDNYQCLLDNVCLERRFVCDGVKHCVGGDDEEGCDMHKCTADEFECGPESDKLCIPLELKCDGHPDCFNHIDEINCTSQCSKDSFLCPEKTCIPSFWKCDGKPDCLNGEDETNCGCEGLDQSPCNVGGCVPTFKVCDGLRQCPDGSDEWGCIKINEDTKKLLVRTSGERWSAVCGDNWTEEWTELVCEQLGLGAPLSSEIISVTDTALIPRMKLSADAPDISRRRRAPLQYFLTHGECHNDSLVHISCKRQECGNWNRSDEGETISNESEKELWPSLGWLIQEHKNSSSDFNRECTASIITRTWVLTSYSCLSSHPNGFEAEKWAFMTGNLTPWARDENTQLRYAKQIVIYPGAKRLRSKWVGDAALVRLQTPLIFSSHIQPICLPESQEASKQDHCVVAFWKKVLKDRTKDKNSIGAQIVQSVQETSLTNLDMCNSSYYGGLLNHRHLCTNLHQDKYASCNSHEGSPLLCRNSDRIWELHGLLSHVGNCASFSLPSVFTDIKSINFWISSNIGRAPPKDALAFSSALVSQGSSSTTIDLSGSSGDLETVPVSEISEAPPQGVQGVYDGKTSENSENLT